MSTITTTQPAALPLPPPDLRPNIDHLVIDDGKPVDGIYSERQMRLLIDPLYASWQGPGDERTFLALANVGMFFSVDLPPVVPDVLLSLDVPAGLDVTQKQNNSYLFWVMGKPPEVVFEIVSNKEGGELGPKQVIYRRQGVSYYVVWDPQKFLKGKDLYCFERHGPRWEENGLWLEEVDLGLTRWEGIYDGVEGVWLRWCDRDGKVLPTGAEKAEQEKKRAEQEKQRAEQEKQRAEKLAAQLRALGVDPEKM